MKKERLKILNMVEEGKITVEEATKLLEALSCTSTFSDEYDFSYDMEEKINNFASCVDSFAKDISEKIESTYNSMEPKLKSTTKKVIEKTVNIVDEISKSLNESLRNLENSNYCCSNSNDDCTDNCTCNKEVDPNEPVSNGPNPNLDKNDSSNDIESKEL